MATQKVRIDKLAVATSGINVLPDFIKANGIHSPPTATQPAMWNLEQDGWHVTLGENVLLLPMDTELSSLIDIWAPQGGKVFSIGWMPTRPWQPPVITHCKAGDWMRVFGLEPDAVPSTDS